MADQGRVRCFEQIPIAPQSQRRGISHFSADGFRCIVKGETRVFTVSDGGLGLYHEELLLEFDIQFDLI